MAAGGLNPGILYGSEHARSGGVGARHSSRAAVYLLPGA